MIRSWISSVLSKIIDYKAQHRGLFNAAEASLVQLPLPDEVVRNNVLPFLELPSHTFDGEESTIKPKVIGKIDEGGDKDGWLLCCFLIPLAYCILIASLMHVTLKQSSSVISLL